MSQVSPKGNSQCNHGAEKAIERIGVQKLMSYDANKGTFFRHYNTRGIQCLPYIAAGSITGKGYLIFSIKGKRVFAHRLAWFLTYGDWPLDAVDHINGDRLDNRIENLREASNTQNRQNMRKSRKDNSLKILGVSTCRGKYQARIKANGVRYNLGTFETPEEAHQVYIAKKREIHEFCTI